MKNLKTLLFSFMIAFTLFSCSDDDDNKADLSRDLIAEMQLKLVKSIEANGHTIELFSDKAQLNVGYNAIYIRVKDETGSYSKDLESLSWMPKMHMTSKMHACPYSKIVNTNAPSLKKGYIVFTMATNTTAYWELNLEYTIKNKAYSVTDKVEVSLENNRRKVMNFMGKDGVKYIVAYVSPKKPEVTTNNSEILLFKMASMMEFPLVKNYTIELDPRMPSMGNHSSPNNENYVYDPVDEIYKGKLSLTMTGYWMLNLRLMNEAGELIAGTAVTEENERSDVYLEIAF